LVRILLQLAPAFRQPDEPLGNSFGGRTGVMGSVRLEEVPEEGGTVVVPPQVGFLELPPSLNDAVKPAQVSLLIGRRGLDEPTDPELLGEGGPEPRELPCRAISLVLVESVDFAEQRRRWA